MEKPDGDSYLHADEDEQGVSLRPGDEHQPAADMNAPEKHQLGAGTKKRKKRDTAGNSTEEELPLPSPSLPSSLSAAGMNKPYGDGCLHADDQKQGASLRSPDQHQLTDMNAPEKHELDAGTKKRVKQSTGGSSVEEEEEDRRRKRMLQIDGGAPAKQVIGVVNEDLALHRSQQGLGATVQFLRDTQENWCFDQQIQTAAGTSDAPRNLVAASSCSINALPLDILNDILMKINSPSIRSAVSSSFVFLRAAMSPCTCDAFRENGSFIAAIVQPKCGRPSVTVPERLRHHPFRFAAIMLQRFITIRYTAVHWHRIVDSRKGHLLIQRNHRANQFDVMRPFLTTMVISLPLIDLRQQEVLITAAIVPEPSLRFVVMMLYREGMDVTLREFRSRQGIWTQQRVRCSLTLSTLSELRKLPLYASNNLYLLDAPQLRVLCFSPEHNLLDSVPLPASEDQAFVQRSSLSRTREGQLCWVALNRWDVTVFAFDGVTWRRKGQWPVPEHFYSCRLIGFAEDSNQVMAGCYGEVCCIDIEEGVRTYLKEAPAADSCVSFEIDHVALDHE